MLYIICDEEYPVVLISTPLWGVVVPERGGEGVLTECRTDDVNRGDVIKPVGLV